MGPGNAPPMWLMTEISRSVIGHVMLHRCMSGSGRYEGGTRALVDRLSSSFSTSQSYGASPFEQLQQKSPEVRSSPAGDSGQQTEASHLTGTAIAAADGTSADQLEAIIRFLYA